MSEAIPPHRYGGARALVELHASELQRFVETWRAARAHEIALPTCDDGDYASLDHLLHHVLRAARGYLRWCCEKLELPEPGIASPPPPAELARDPEPTLAHILERWRTPLAEVEEERFYRPPHESWWKVPYCVDAMLEHAVMHPVRHRHQLERLLRQAGHATA